MLSFSFFLSFSFEYYSQDLVSTAITTTRKKKKNWPLCLQRPKALQIKLDNTKSLRKTANGEGIAMKRQDVNMKQCDVHASFRLSPP